MANMSDLNKLYPLPRLLDLPLEMVNEIILVVPLIDLFRVSKVCKLFQKLAYNRRTPIITKEEYIQAACDGNILNILDVAVERPWHNNKFRSRNEGLYSACHMGYMEIVELMIHKGADNFEDGLKSACLGSQSEPENATRSFGGHMDIVKLLIIHGANNYDACLFNACEGGNIDIVKLMIKNEADDWNWGAYWSMLRRTYEYCTVVNK